MQKKTTQVLLTNIVIKKPGSGGMPPAAIWPNLSFCAAIWDLRGENFVSHTSSVNDWLFLLRVRIKNVVKTGPNRSGPVPTRLKTILTGPENLGSTLTPQKFV